MSEIHHCRWWLDAEIAQVKPKLILAMGATAAESLTGKRDGILSRRGGIERTISGLPVLITLHPAYLLRLRDPQAAAQGRALFQGDLEKAVALMSDARDQGDR